MNATILLSVLQHLMALTGAGAHTSATTLARAVGTSPTNVARALLHLERRGLCDASRMRLTLGGLMIATAAGAAAAATDDAAAERFLRAA
jgi:DNA-binding IclR family transcriptional regulator